MNNAILNQLIAMLNQALIALINLRYPSNLVILATGIRDYEGLPGALNYQLCNPGDCRPSPEGYLPKYEPVVIVDTDTDPAYPYHKGKFAKFPSYAIGWTYLLNLLRNMIENHPNWTLNELMAAYAPATDANEPLAYAANLGRRLGENPATYQIKHILT